MAWPDSCEGEIEATIGTAQAHANIDAWEQATDIDIVTAEVSPVGVCNVDEELTENPYLYGATTSENYYRRLTVAAGVRHDGTAYGGGAEVVTSGNYAVRLRDQFVVIEWLILSGTGDSFGPYYCPDNSRIMMRNLASCSSGSAAFVSSSAGAGTLSYLRNSIAHSNSGYSAAYLTYVQNCSFLSTVAYAVRNLECTNVICVGASTACFYTCTGDYNISSDATAPYEGDSPGHSIFNIAAGDLFASVGAPLDLRLKSDETAASDAGTDLSGATYPFTIDCKGGTRTDWDIGADEYAGAPPAGLSIPIAMRHYMQMMGAS